MPTLEELAKAEASAALRVEAMSMTNVFGMTFEERQSAAVAYAQARRALHLAQLALEAAIQADPDDTQGEVT